MSTPVVSVVIPARDAAATLGQTLDALLAQTFQTWEAILVDDGSRDETPSIAALYAERAPRIRVVAGPGQGVSAARNLGLEQARSDWLLFLDADDLILPRHLERLTEALTGDPSLDAVCCGWARVGDDGATLSSDSRVLAGDLFDALAHAPLFAIHACLVRRSLVRGVGGFDLSLRTCEDWDLWLRIARTGARFGSLPDVLALYRMRAGTASANGRQLLADGLRVLRRARKADPRVPTAAPAHARGAAVEEEADWNLACWCAGLEIGAGRDVDGLLDGLPPEAARGLEPRGAARDFVTALTSTARRPVSAWWPDRQDRVEAFLALLEERSGQRGIARRLRRRIEDVVLAALEPTEPIVVGATYALPLDVARPIPDVKVPAGIERVRCSIQLDGERIGDMELPVCDGRVPARVLADAIAAEHAWSLLGRFFERTVYRGLHVAAADGQLVLKRGDVPLASGLPTGEQELRVWVHDAVGWTVLLQEVWGLPDRPDAFFYDPSAPAPPSDTAPHLVTARCGSGTGTQPRIQVELSQALPSLEVAGPGAEVVMIVGGVPVGVALIAQRGAVSPQILRVALTTAAGFELCRAVVREAVLGRPPGDGVSLRDRLARAAVRRADSAEFSGVASAAMPDRTLVLGYRERGIVGASDSRWAALPAAAADWLLDAAALAGEPVVGSPAKTTHERVLYAPGVLATGRPIPAVEPPPRPAWARTAETAVARTHGRGHFEALFAGRADPWRYTSVYEQTKYEQTLELLPPGPFSRALEIGCAEGHFTAQLAPRVGDLLAVDVSQLALERAAERCSGLGNVRFQRCDAFADPLPGRFDLVVCSEMLYYAGSLTTLRRTARGIADALEPGGHLVTAHANLLIDDPDQPGFDWDVPFGARVIGETFAAIPGLQLAAELRTPAYRIQLFRRENSAWRGILRKAPVVVERPFVAQPETGATLVQSGASVHVAPAPVQTARLPILMYHRVATDGPDTLRRYRVTPEAFEEHLRYLQDAGYHGIRLDDWRQAMAARQPLPGRAVLLTFDDGYLDFLTTAWPLLRQYGFSALVFLVTDEVGGQGRWDAAFGDAAPLLDWQQVQRLQAEGIEFGAHSATHPNLTALSPAELTREAAKARAELLRRLGTFTPAFAYPYGDVDPSVRHLVGACGYLYGLTAGGGASRFSDHLLSLPRIEIVGSDRLQDVVHKLETASR